jgi:AcrR family transcriptional regulator
MEKNTAVVRIKQGLITLLQQKCFEEIHVSDICRQAGTSRVTFYNWFDDKFDLLHSIFEDLGEEVRQNWTRRQKEENPQDDPVLAYCLLNEVLMDMQQEHSSFLDQAAEEKDQWLYFYYYTGILHCLESFMDAYSWKLNPRFSTRQTAAFLCGGFWGFIRCSRQEGISDAELRRQSRDLLTTILKSDAFMGREKKKK